MPGAFTKAFVRAVQYQTASTQIPQALSIDAVLNFLKEDPDLPASQQAQWSVVVSSGELPDFLPNPRRDTAPADSNSTEQDRRRRADSMIEALVYTMRDLNQQTAGVMHEIERTGQPAFITRHGRFVATITPLEPGRVESRILAEIAREIMAGQTGKPEGV
jgi:antitoxin (DNA-binding transcriptional repressor) of toxin-antitoxin stability system